VFFGLESATITRKGEQMIQILNEWLPSKGITEEFSFFLANCIALAFIFLLSLAAYFITKKIILRILSYFIRKNRSKWDSAMLERKVFTRLSHITPAIVVYSFAGMFPEYQTLIQKLAVTYLIFMGVWVLDAFLNALEDIYKTFEISKSRPIKSFIQVIKIFIYIIGCIWIISIIIDRSPLLLLSGIGALTAIVTLVFKDSLLGLVGGIQLSANDMVRIGDWIEMPKYGADGDVVDISLNTVKIKNFDNTITTVPTYALISDSFKNWRGMQEAGGRRIKRAVNIDSSSIRFCTDEMLNRFAKIQYISDYIQNKKQEIDQYNQQRGVDASQLVNGRRLTNIGTFRAYLEAYLRNHPGIHQGMIQMVRQLPPGENGLPIEIYAFTKDTDWAAYEAVQADIFDHIMAVVPQFDLRIHQNPTGYDFRRITD